MSISFDERFDRLLAAMGDLADLLSSYGEAHWADWVRRDMEKIRRYQQHGLESMLMAFGGMGSLTDVYIHPANGHPIGPDQIDQANQELARLTSTVYSDASALRRELEQPRPPSAL